MKKIGVINKHNLSQAQIRKLPIRKKVRGVIFKDKNTLICVEENSNNIKNLLGLPGGAVENKEVNIEAFKREVLEETGYEVKDVKSIGIIQVIRKKYISYTTCYISNTKGRKRKLNLTQDEIEVNTKPIEINIEKAIKRIESEYNKSPNDNSLRSLIILNNI
jgi:ADP-ribose pyrophosphatase YjhB (NUDIX family)